MRHHWFLTRRAGHASPAGPRPALSSTAGDQADTADPAAREAPDPDAALATALRSGEPRAASQLYHAYAQPLYRFVHRRTGDAELAQDVVQDVMVRIWQ